MQPILDNEAQFVMLVSLLLFILSYSSFINRLKDIIWQIENKYADDKELVEEKSKPSMQQQHWLKVATIILFISLFACLVRIFVAFFWSQSSYWLAWLDLTVLSTFFFALVISIGIFRQAYYKVNGEKKKDEGNTKDKMSAKTLASSHISLAIALFGFWLLTTGIPATINFILALFFILSSIMISASICIRIPEWLTNFIWGLSISYLSFFLGILALGIGLVTKNYIILGFILILISYLVLGIGIGASMAQIVAKKRKRKAAKTS